MGEEGRGGGGGSILSNGFISSPTAKEVSGTEDQMERIERSLNFVSDGKYSRSITIGQFHMHSVN